MAFTLPQPTLWQSLPFGDRDAFTDFLGQHALWHFALDQQLRAKVGAKAYPSLSLGDGPIDDGSDWHLSHQAMHDGEASNLALSASPSFTSYDLNKKDDFAAWTWLHSNEHRRLATSAGI